MKLPGVASLDRLLYPLVATVLLSLFVAFPKRLD